MRVIEYPLPNDSFMKRAFQLISQIISPKIKKVSCVNTENLSSNICNHTQFQAVDPYQAVDKFNQVNYKYMFH